MGNAATFPIMNLIEKMFNLSEKPKIMKFFKNVHLIRAQRITQRLLFRKLIVFSMLILGSMSAIAQTEATVTLNLTQVSMIEALEALQEKTEINLVYNHEELAKCGQISLKLDKVTVGQALDTILKGCGFTWSKVNSNIVIVPRKSTELETKPESPVQNIRGKVVDRASNTTLPFANVVVLNTDPQRGTTTDTDGNFLLEDLPVGRYILQVSYMGYTTIQLPEIQLGSAREVYVTAAIEETMHDISEIAVSVKKGEPLNEMATVSAKSFSVEETKRYPASVGDPARMAQVFAGVAGSDDASNEIVIRGNSPNWMLWRLEGVEIPSPNHFAEEGYSAGAVSILNTNTLGKSDFYTGAFPGEYGNALSGVFDIKMRNGNNTENQYALEAGVLGIEAAAEGPFKKGYAGSYLINYRYSTFSLINALNLNSLGNSLPSYQDVSFKVNLPAGKAGTFSLWGIGGASVDDQKYLPDTTLGEKLEYGYSDITKTGMYAGGLSHTFFPDQKSYLKTVVSYSRSYSSQDYMNMDSTGILHKDYYDDLQKGAIRLTSYYNRKISKQLTIRSGATVSLLDYDYFTKSYDSLGVETIHVDSEGETNLYQAYLQGKYRFKDNISLTAGVHYTHFELNRQNVLEPRAGLLIELRNDQKVTLGFGMHSRHENLPVYFVEFENANGSISYLNRDLKLTRSAHYVVGYEKMFGSSFNAKVEAYYQQITDLAVPDNPDKYWAPMFGGILENDTLASIGEGRNYGVELTLQKYFTNSYYFLITSSLFDAKYKPADGKWHNSYYNINYVNNLVAGKEIAWGSNRMLGINTKLVWSGGKRILPVDLDASIEEGSTVYHENDFFSYKGPDYFRIDLGLKLHFFKTKTEHVISLDVQNVTNRLNVWAEVFDPEDEKIVDYPMTGIIPILSYRIEF